MSVTWIFYRCTSCRQTMRRAATATVCVHCRGPVERIAEPKEGETMERGKFKVGDRVRLAEEWLHRFPKYRDNPYGVILWIGRQGSQDTAKIRTQFDEDVWYLGYWYPAPPEIGSREWLERRAVIASCRSE